MDSQLGTRITRRFTTTRGSMNAQATRRRRTCAVELDRLTRWASMGRRYSSALPLVPVMHARPCRRRPSLTTAFLGSGDDHVHLHLMGKLQYDAGLNSEGTS